MNSTGNAGKTLSEVGEINNSERIEVFESKQDLVQSTRANKFLIVTDNVPPGFVMLKTVKMLRMTSYLVH